MIESVPVLPDPLAGAGLGALLGAGVAERHRAQGGRIPHDWIVARWSLGVAAVFALLATVAELL